MRGGRKRMSENVQPEAEEEEKEERMDQKVEKENGGRRLTTTAARARSLRALPARLRGGGRCTGYKAH